MFARFENLPVADFRYRILFCGGVAPCLGSTPYRGEAALPGSLRGSLCEPPFGMPRRLTPRVNWRKEGWEYYERYSPSQKAGRG